MKTARSILAGYCITSSAATKFIVVSILSIMLFGPVIPKLLDLWYTDADYSHGFFVIPISLFMLWLNRVRIREAQRKPSWIGLPILLLSTLTFAVSFLSSFHTLTHLSLIATIIGILLFMYGWPKLKTVILPVLFLAFMFPIPSSFYVMITNPLKLLVTKLSAGIVDIVGMPVYREGNLLYFAETQIEVVEACSGIRSMYSYLMLGIIFSFMCSKLSRKIILILLAIPLAIFVNIVRVSGTGILANLYGEIVAQGFFHEFAGFVIFAVGFVLMLLAYYFLEEIKSNLKS